MAATAAAVVVAPIFFLSLKQYYYLIFAINFVQVKKSVSGGEKKRKQSKVSLVNGKIITLLEK